MKSIAHTRTHMPVASLLSRQWSARLLARVAQSSIDATSPAACAIVTSQKHEGLLIGRGQSQVTDYKSQVTGYKLQVTSYKLQVTGYRLQVTSYRLQVTGYKSYVTFAIAPNFKQLTTTGTP